MKFHVRSFRRGLPILKASGAWDELCDALGTITIEQIEHLRLQRQAQSENKAGIQTGLNKLISNQLAGERGWTPEVAVFKADNGSKKGLWTMDFAKLFENEMRVGVEVTFNHAEAIPWTILRPTLAHEAEGVEPGARIHVGVIIIGTDNLKGNSKDGLRMDSAVGTYERLLTLLPKMRAVVPCPFVIIGLDWENGGLTDDVKELSLHRSDSQLNFE